MPAITGQNVRKLLESRISEHGELAGRQWIHNHFREAYEAGRQGKPGGLRKGDIRFRDLFESLVPGGRDILRSWGNTKRADEYNYHPQQVAVQEGAGGSSVGYSDFSHITGQIYFNAIIENYNYPDFIFSQAIPEVGSDIQDIERFARTTQVGDLTGPPGSGIGIPEGADYPKVGLGEDYIDTAAKIKSGGILDITKEALLGDRTETLEENAGNLGYSLGYMKEELACDCILDLNTTAKSAYTGGAEYTWRGTSYSTYQTSTPWINKITGNAFTDETTVSTLWKTLVAITDPFTGRPILPKIKHLILTPQLAWQGSRILGVTEFRQYFPGLATSGNPAQSISAPALTKMLPGLTLMSSQIFAARMTTGSEAPTDWFLGDIGAAFRYIYNWKITPEQLGASTEYSFMRDVVVQHKASRKGVYATWNPRYMGKSTT